MSCIPLDKICFHWNPKSRVFLFERTITFHLRLLCLLPFHFQSKIFSFHPEIVISLRQANYMTWKVHRLKAFLRRQGFIVGLLENILGHLTEFWQEREAYFSLHVLNTELLQYEVHKEQNKGLQCMVVTQVPSKEYSRIMLTLAILGHISFSEPVLLNSPWFP